MTELVELPDSVVEKLMAMLAANDAVDQALLTTSDSFDDMGFDSLTLLELAIQIENTYSLNVSAGELASFNNIEGIAAKLTEKLRDEAVS